MEGKKNFDSLSQEDKLMISESWGKVYVNTEKLAVPMLIRLFKTDPSTQQYFSKFKDIEDLEELAKTADMKNLADKFMVAINTMVENMNNTEEVTKVFNTLGNVHAVQQSVDFKHFKGFTEIIVTVLKEGYAEVMTAPVTKAWNNFFVAMCANFNTVYQEVGKGN